MGDGRHWRVNCSRGEGRDRTVRNDEGRPFSCGNAGCAGTTWVSGGSRASGENNFT